MPQRNEKTQDEAWPSGNADRGRRPSSRHASRSSAQMAMWCTGIGLILASLLPLAPSDDWWIRALDFPRPHIAALLLLQLVLAWVLLDRRRWATRALLAGLAGIRPAGLPAVALHAAACGPSSPISPTCPESDRLSVVAANLQARTAAPHPSSMWCGAWTRTWFSWLKLPGPGSGPCSRSRVVIPTVGSIPGPTSGSCALFTPRVGQPGNSPSAQ